jgi:hypothetical protein
MNMNAQFVCTGSDIFIVCDGVRIARRGYPGTPQAGTWVSLGPGYRVFDSKKKRQIVIECGGDRATVQ